MTNFDIEALTDDQREQLADLGIITPDAAVDPLPDAVAEDEDLDAEKYTDLPELKRLDTQRPSAKFAFLTRAKALAEKLQTVEEGGDDDELDAFSEALPDIEDFVLSAAADPEAMEAWFSTGDFEESINRVIHAFKVVIESQEKGLASHSS